VTPVPAHPVAAHPFSGLARALADAGAVLVPADASGALPASGREATILERLLTSPSARGIVARSAARWALGGDSVQEPLPGLVVMPLRLPRLPSGGRFAALTILEDGIDGETLDRLAQAAELDARLARSLLRVLPPWERRALGRLVSVVGALARGESERLAGVESGVQLSSAWEELHLLHSLSGEMAVGVSPRTFALRTLAELRQTIGCRWTALRVGEAAAALLDVEPGEVLSDGSSTDEAAFVLEAVGDPERAAVEGPGLVVAPVRRERESFGVLAAGERTAGDGEMSGHERALVETAARNLGVFLDNARLYRDLDRMFIGSLAALVSAIDAKDPYTRGHSQRVALLSRRLAEAARLSAAEVKNVYIAGLVHDVGKIGVPEQVLRKQGRLTDEEFAQVKLHPEIGWRILRDIPQFAPVLDGVRYHHERYDGGGYPHGLAGASIPIAARIIGLADTFDAMSSNRTYRRALGRREVLAEMASQSGRQFDPALLSRFLALDFAGYDALAGEVAGSGDASSLDAIPAEAASGALSLDALARLHGRRAA